MKMYYGVLVRRTPYTAVFSLQSGRFCTAPSGENTCRGAGYALTLTTEDDCNTLYLAGSCTEENEEGPA